MNIPTHFRSGVIAMALMTVIAPGHLSAFERVTEAQVQAKNIRRYEFAQKQGAKVLQTSDGQTVGVLWYPKGLESDPNKRLLVTLHGHASLATDEFFLWHKFAEKYPFQPFKHV